MAEAPQTPNPEPQTLTLQHLHHARLVLDAVRANHLDVKKSNCSFGKRSVAYLGHIISPDGVAMDSSKVATMAS